MNHKFIALIKTLYRHIFDAPYWHGQYMRTDWFSPRNLLELVAVVIAVIVAYGWALSSKEKQGRRKFYSDIFLLLLGGIGAAVDLHYYYHFSPYFVLLVLVVPWVMMGQVLWSFMRHTPKGMRFLAIGMLVICFLLWISGASLPVMKFLHTLKISIGHYSITAQDLILALFWSVIIYVCINRLMLFLQHRVMRMGTIDRNSRLLFASLLRIFGFALTIIFIAPLLGIDLKALTLVGSAFAAGFGFGLKNIVNNYIAGFILLIDKSIKLNDRITLGDFTGYVIQITSRFVKLRSYAGIEAYIPNERMISELVINESSIYKEWLQEFYLDIDSNNDLAKAINIIDQAIDKRAKYTAVCVKQSLSDGRVLTSGQEKHIMINKITPTTVNIKVSYWIVGAPDLPAKIHSDILLDIHRRFKEEQIAWPRRAVCIDGSH